MIKFHPTHQKLKDFALGVLSPTESLMLSAHCDMCSMCRTFVSKIEEEEAERFFNQECAFIDQSNDDFSSIELVNKIVSNADNDSRSKNSVHHVEKQSASIELDGRLFQLPRTLQRYAGKTGNWSSLVGKLWQAPVDLGPDGAANFIYMAMGGSVPEHTHRGSELTLVINGKFDDGINEYQSGDFIALDNHHIHTPKASSPEGCLVFSVIDQPLHFTSGIARLLNPFSHLFFR